MPGLYKGIEEINYSRNNQIKNSLYDDRQCDNNAQE